MSSIVILLLLQIKHFICDFPLQKSYQYLNKGTYGHLGGLLHAAIHAVGTFIIISFVDIYLAVLLSMVDFVVHYHIDWAKTKLNKHWGLKPDSSEYFWILLGLDQLLHQLTYVGFIWVL